MDVIAMIWSRYLVHVIDVLLVAYIFYQILAMIKGTRAVQVILGIVTLLVITFIANVPLKLMALSWLLEKFWITAVIIIVVVFQPEIRSALAKLGTHKWNRVLLTPELAFIHEIIEAIRHCASNRVGGLIVLEQDTGLRNFIESGTVINAQVSKELIIALFNVRSPLHDGAIIIQDARLTAAGCFLPLSHDPSISKILGTRHRAAMGLSEISDAIMIVVSEESGSISLARNGKLEINVDLDDLRKRLMDLYRTRAEDSLLHKVRRGKEGNE